MEFSHFNFSDLTFREQLEIYALVCRNHTFFKTNFEMFRSKHLGYLEPSRGIICYDSKGKPIGWRAYLPLLHLQNVTHYAGVDACVNNSARGNGLLKKMTSEWESQINSKCVIYGYPNAQNKSYDASGYETLGYFNLRLPAINKNETNSLPNNIQNLRFFKQRFLEYFNINHHILFSHPTRKSFVLTHDRSLPISTYSKCIIKGKIPLSLWRSSNIGPIRQVGKNFNVSKDHMIYSSEFSDFL